MNTAQVSEAADRLVALAWVQAWQIALVTLVVAVLARTVCRRRPHLAYLLWMLVVVKALTPPLVASRAGVFSWMLRTESPPAVVAVAPPAPRTPAPPRTVRFEMPKPTLDDELDEQPAAAPLPIVPEPAPQLPQITRAQALLGVWLLGAVALSLYAVAKWIGCRGRWRRAAIDAPAALIARVDELAEQLDLRPAVRRRLRILVSRGAGSPAVFGVNRPTLLLPADLLDNNSASIASSAGTAQLDAILAHELIHVRRGDPAVALLQLVAQVLWWFHPLVWFANREARRERERACDEEVVTGLRCRPADYARALLDVLERQTSRQPAFAVPGVGMLGVTARRLEHLLGDPRRFQRRTPRWYYALALLALVVLVPGAGLNTAAAPRLVVETQDRDDVVADGDNSETISANKADQPEKGQAPRRDVTPAEAAAIARLRATGAVVSDDLDDRGRRVIGLQFDMKWRGTEEDVALIAQLPSVQALYWSCAMARPEILATARTKTPIEHLTLDNNPSTALLEKLAQLPRAKSLILSESTLTDAGAKRLAELAGDVETLVISGNNQPGELGDAGLARLALLPKLKQLHLAQLPITDTGLKHLGRLPLLETLTIHSETLAGRTLDELTTLEHLRNLSVSGSALEVAAFAAAAHLSQIRNLALTFDEKTPLPADKIGVLAKLTALDTLQVMRNSTIAENEPVPHGMEDVATGNALLKVAGQLPKLKNLYLFGIITSDPGFAALTASQAAAPSPGKRVLRTINLTPVYVMDAGLAAISQCDSLRRLSLSGESEITAKGFRALANLVDLEELHLPAKSVTDDMLADLAKLKKLNTLDLLGSKITGAGLKSLEGLWRLRAIELPNSPFNDAGSEALTKFPLLTWLVLSDTEITDAAAANLAKLTHLQKLDLSTTRISDAGLAKLAALKDLSRLNLLGTAVTDAGKESLAAALPQLQIQDNNFGAQLVFTGDFAPLGEESDTGANDVEATDGAAAEAASPVGNPDNAQPAPDQKPGVKKKSEPLLVFAAIDDDVDAARKIVETRSISIRGQIDGEDGKPVAGAKVTLFALGMTGVNELATVTANAEGRYEIRDAELPIGGGQLSEGMYQVYATADGRGIGWQGVRYLRPVNRPKPGERNQNRPTAVFVDDQLEADIVLPGVATMRGKLVDDSDKPIEGAKVTVIQCHTLTEDKRVPFEELSLVVPAPSLATTTAADGTFTIGGLPQESVAVVEILHPDFGKRGVQVGFTDNPQAKNRFGHAEFLRGEVDLRLARAQKIDLRLLYGDTQTPASQAAVGLWHRDTVDVFAEGATDEQGQLQIRIPPGKYEVTIQPPRGKAQAEYLETNLPLVVPDAPATEPTVLRLPAACTLEVATVDADSGQPVPGVTIAGSPYGTQENDRPQFVIGRSDDNGKLTRRVPPGRRRLGVVPQRGYEVVDEPQDRVELPGGKTVAITVKLRKQKEQPQLPGENKRAAAEPPANGALPSSNAQPQNPSPQAAGPAPAAGGDKTYGVQLVFTPDVTTAAGDTPAEGKNPEPAALDTADLTATPAARKLIELGAEVYSRRPKAGLGVNINESWRGTDADFALVAELPQVADLLLDLNRVSAEALGRLKLSQPLQALILRPLTDEGLAKFSALPRARFVSIADAALTARGCTRLAELLGDVESLSIICRRGPQKQPRELTALERAAGATAVFEIDDSAKVEDGVTTSGVNAKIDTPPAKPKPPGFVGDAGLAALLRLQGLRKLTLRNAGITDAGLAKVSQLPRLDSLSLDACSGVTGTGLAALQPLAGMRRLTLSQIPLSAEGLRALGKLSQLENLFLAPARYAPDGFAALAGLTNLRTLSLGDEWRFQDGPLQAATGDAALKLGARLPKLENLTISALKVTDDGIEALAGATSLRQLYLSPIIVTDRTLAAVGKLTKIESLSLQGEPEMIQGTSQISDAGLASLSSLARLQHLALPAAGGTDKGLASFDKLTALQSLTLSNSSIDGSGLAALRGLKNLRVLGLANSAFDDAGAKNLPAFQSLTALDLNSTRITDAAFDAIGQLKKLTSLSVDGVKVTGVGLLKLGDLKDLNQLVASGWNVSEEQFAELKKAHPVITIHGRDWPGADPGQPGKLVAGGVVIDTTNSYVILNIPPGALDAQETKEEAKPAASEPRPAEPPTPKAEPQKNDSAQSPPAPVGDLSAALAKLRELGLEFVPEDPAAAARQLESVGFTRGWKGKADDLRALNQVPKIKLLHADLTEFDPADLDVLAPRQRIATLILSHASDATLAKIKSLPLCRSLHIDQCELSAAGAEKIVALAPTATALQISGPYRRPGDNTPPAGISDDALRHIGTMRELTQLDLLVLGITDAGLAQLAPLEKLIALHVIECPGVHGSGIAKLSRLENLKVLVVRIPLDSAGFEAIAKLNQLESLWILADAARPEDFGQLVGLQKLRSLSVLSESDPDTAGAENEQARARKTQLGNAVLAAAGKLPILRGLGVNGFRASFAGLAALAPAEKLESLNMTGVEITDEGLAELGRMKKLRMLSLSGSGAPTAAGLAHLAGLDDLHNLALIHTTIADDALDGLAELKSLISLTLAQSPKLTGSGLAALVPLEKLKSLSLTESALADASVVDLAKLQALAALDLSGTPITDKAIPALAQMTTLETLDLSKTTVTPDALEQLKTLKGLRKIDLLGTKAPKEQIAALRKALPGVEIGTNSNWVLFSAAKFEDDEAEEDAAAGNPATALEPAEK